MLTGDNGILTQAQNAKRETEEAQKEEENILNSYENFLNTYSGENTEFTDSLGNIVKVPAGFRVINLGDNVEDGIIIEDVTNGATKGSQFVWIPVGKNIKKKDGTTFDITLGRYEFNSETGSASQYKGNLTEDTEEEHIYDNIPAKDIETFITSVNSNGGYYIGRYEARTKIERKSKEDELAQVTVKQDDFVYNYVTQSQAANLSRNMYNNSNFESDLVNSYAWDTALVFIQKCSEKSDYSLQFSINDELANKGTNNLENQDKVCNIFDMASNCFDWSTETTNKINLPCVSRGGVYGYDDYYAYGRGFLDTNLSDEGSGFRIILYL